MWSGLRQRAARSLGQSAEDLASAYLQARGLRLVQRNYRVRGGEIDLIMRAADASLVFVEVRARSSGNFGGAAGSIDARKRRRIVLAARHYLARLPAEPNCRFDVVALDAGRLEWLPGAFAIED
ncbi:hypothetical protein GALL_431030 [mine drainage metagenome]|uniref:Uncharacterized protein n=1 Tax=mine drainage metagenome TaxID=410659 RepID=A0A1J5QCL0_9ZZZZ